MIWGGAEVVMLALGSGCKYRLSLAERFDCTETIINQLLADSHESPISEWQVTTSLGLPLILHYNELYNYFHYLLQWNNNRNKVHNKGNVLESSRNHPRSVEKLSSTKLVPGAKKGWGLLLQETNAKKGLDIQGIYWGKRSVKDKGKRSSSRWQNFQSAVLMRHLWKGKAKEDWLGRASDQSQYSYKKGSARSTGNCEPKLPVRGIPHQAGKAGISVSATQSLAGSSG